MYLKVSRRSSQRYSLFILLFTLFLCACRQHHRKPGPSGFADETFAEKLSAILLPVDTAATKKMRSVRDEVRLVYQLDDYQPIWVKENYSTNEAAGRLIGELEDMRWDGVDPDRYNITALRNLKIKLDTTKKNSIADAIAFDTALTHSYLAAARYLLMGEVVPKKADSLWFHANDSVWNAPQLLLDPTGQYPSLADFRSSVPTYQLLRDEYRRYYDLVNDTSFCNAVYNVQNLKKADNVMLASVNYIIRIELPWLETVPNDSVSEQKQLIMTYQQYRALKPTGKLDSATLAYLTLAPETYLQKIRANMERIRWMQREFGNTYIIVNVPLMELFFRKDSINVMHMRVVVGKPIRQTPSIYSRMANVVINPQWGVPPTILKNDVLPGIQKSGKQYMAKKGLKAYDREGKMVNVSTINMRNYRRYSYKQAPGVDNSLGYIKFNLPNPWDIYLHDTPHREDFVKRDRALSSGCVRVQQPQEMALYVLSELEHKKQYTQGRLDTMIGTHKTRWEVLKTKIPVHITYLTAFEDTTGAHIQFTRDIYERDNKLISLLN